MSNSSAVEALFFAALELGTPAERAAYLDSACGGDAELRRQVEKMLNAHPRVGDFLNTPIVERISVAPEQPDVTQELASTAVPVLRDGSSLAQTQGEGSGNEGGLDFLQPSTRPGSLGRLGHYEVLQVLGRGGFGIVFRAFDEALQRVVAVKVLAPQMAASAPARRRFLREARSSARVRHDNVIQVYAVVDEPLPYLVMEFVAGETLQQRLDRAGPLEPAEVVRIGRQIADGLAAAHATGLIHRDIKPANILIEAGPDQWVKITDFGLARAADDASLTQSGLVAGTPMYMAPEQAESDALDHRADLFSLGSVLYTLCSGRPPFRANSTLAVLRRVAEDTPRPIREIVPEVPEWLCDLISKLHAKKPDDRIATAGEVADLLERGPAAETIPPREHPEAGPANGSRFRGGRWVAAAAVLLVLLGGFGFTEATGVTNVRGTVIRLFSPEGTLVVEVDDPGVSVQIDGSEIVITGAGAKEIRLKPGSYTVQATKDGKVVSRELVTVAKNGKRVVRVRLEAEWERSVAALPALDQVKAVVARLQGLNPDFDGKVESTIENGAVTGLAFSTDSVHDISPVRVLTGLRSLNCSGSDVNRGQLSDLSSLRGLPLTNLYCLYNPVSDLSPLKGMDLTSLDLRHTNVGDAEVKTLAGLKNLQWLSLWGTKVTDVGLKNLAGLKRLQWLSLETTQVTDAGLKNLARLHRLAHLSLYNVTQVTDAGLGELAGLKELKYLDLRGANITDAGARKLASALPSLGIEVSGGRIQPRQSLDPDRRAAEYLLSLGGGVRVNDQEQEIKAVADLPPEAFRLTCINFYFSGKVLDADLAKVSDGSSHLTVLALVSTQVTDAGLAHLKDRKNLFHLDLRETPVTDAGLANFKDCKDLKFLGVRSNTKATDAGLAFFTGCKNLLLLDLQDYRQLTDAGLVHFKDSKNLQFAFLQNTQVSDVGLGHLKDHKNLGHLSLQGTRVTAAGIDELKKALPNCTIEWDGGVIEPK